jgi:hypothetical protein
MDLSPAEVAKIKDEWIARASLDDPVWSWRWLVWWSDLPLQTKAIAMLVSLFREFGKGDGAGHAVPIDVLAAFTGLTGRTIVRHTNALNAVGFFHRISGDGRGNVTIYPRRFPEKLIAELAERTGITTAPLKGDPPKKGDTHDTLKQERVTPVTAFSEKG